MTLFLLFDLAIVLILLVFFFLGLERGFVLTLFGLLAIVVAFAGARILSDRLTPVAARMLEPRLAEAIEKRLDRSDLPMGGEPDESGLPHWEDLLAAAQSLGLSSSLARSIEEELARRTDVIEHTVAGAVAAVLAQSILSIVIFFVAFVLILILWWVISHALDLVSRLPGLNFLNRTLGGILGLVKGLLILAVAVWLLYKVGGIIPEEAAGHTFLLRFFMTGSLPFFSALPPA